MNNKYFFDQHNWDHDGDCIGLGAAYGKSGDFIQSDI